MVTKTNLSISHKGWENLKAQTGGTFLKRGNIPHKGLGLSVC